MDRAEDRRRGADADRERERRERGEARAAREKARCVVEVAEEGEQERVSAMGARRSAAAESESGGGKQSLAPVPAARGGHVLRELHTFREGFLEVAEDRFAQIVGERPGEQAHRTFGGLGGVHDISYAAPSPAAIVRMARRLAFTATRPSELRE